MKAVLVRLMQQFSFFLRFLCVLVREVSFMSEIEENQGENFFGSIISSIETQLINKLKYS